MGQLVPLQRGVGLLRAASVPVSALRLRDYISGLESIRGHLRRGGAGLYKLRIQLTHSLKPPAFNP
jgi:hypothetical protein